MLAAVRGAVHLALDDGIVSVTSAGVPLMANAVRVDVPPERLAGVAPGGAATLDRRGLQAGTLRVRLPVAPPVAATAVGRWDGPPAVVDVDAIRSLSARLPGRGPGLTPEGDDLLAGVALALVARGRRAEAALLAPPDLEARTTSLAATLVRLATRGHGPEPAVRMLASEAAGRDAAERELVGLGGSTGAAIARGVRAVLDGVPLASLRA